MRSSPQSVPESPGSRSIGPPREDERRGLRTGCRRRRPRRGPARRATAGRTRRRPRPPPSGSGCAEHAGVDGRQRDRRGHVRLRRGSRTRRSRAWPPRRVRGAPGARSRRVRASADDPTGPCRGTRAGTRARAVGLEAGGDGGHESRRRGKVDLVAERGQDLGEPIVAHRVRLSHRPSSPSGRPSARSRSSARESRDLTVPGRIPSALRGLRLRELEQVPVRHDEPVAVGEPLQRRRAGPAAPPARAPRPRGTGPRPPSRGRPRGAASSRSRRPAERRRFFASFETIRRIHGRNASPFRNRASA